MSERWDQRFFSTTRGQVVTLLRRAGRTVNELAAELDLTDNAVRLHLATLERDGLVVQEGVRRGAGKPSFAYRLTPQAERLFPKPYGPMLDGLLDVLAERLPPAELEAAMREVGHRLAAGREASPGELRHRVAQGAALLEALGGLAEVEKQAGGFSIRGYSCPLADVAGHPEACRLAETLLADVIGAPVRECCDRGNPPRCRFVITSPDDTGSNRA
ncbi:MAG TPA: helix-turn-helix domain-containing protein [Thermomicrobiaceae bacterium]|nr:helix-turn-helix domain-containing protein [Thermomicrobiaceae bacterium]